MINFDLCLPPLAGPGKQPPRAWRDKEPSKTDPLPEWASDDSVTSTTVGTFDSSGNFTASAEKVSVQCVYIVLVYIYNICMYVQYCACV